jgi:hypothetical protein
MEETGESRLPTFPHVPPHVPGTENKPLIAAVNRWPPKIKLKIGHSVKVTELPRPPGKVLRFRRLWNPNPSTPLRAGSNVEKRDVRMGTLTPSRRGRARTPVAPSLQRRMVMAGDPVDRKIWAT